MFPSQNSVVFVEQTGNLALLRHGKYVINIKYRCAEFYDSAIL